MLIVEGPDGAGKTTLVNRLNEMYGLTVGARGTTDRDLLWTVTVPDTMRAMGMAVGGTLSPKIWDRLYYSDFVYASLGATPRPVAFNPSQQVHVDKIIEALRCPIIVCLPPWEVVQANGGTKHEMPGVLANLERIYREYHRMTYAVGDARKAFPDHRVVYDYTDDGESWEIVMNEVEDYLDERQERMY